MATLTITLPDAHLAEFWRGFTAFNVWDDETPEPATPAERKAFVEAEVKEDYLRRRYLKGVKHLGAEDAATEPGVIE